MKNINLASLDKGNDYLKESFSKKISDYWDIYYAQKSIFSKSIPSQFAVFLTCECQNTDLIIDAACGDGRDSFFFAEYFPRVLGVDNSSSAIESCSTKAMQEKIENLEFLHSNLCTPDEDDRVSEKIFSYESQVKLIYARFFLHAITDAQQAAFFSWVNNITSHGDSIALEYRTTRDALGVKETPKHFRRYLNPPEVEYALNSIGFRSEYHVEGYGFAKYKHDDAYVSRTLHKKVRT